MLLTNQIETLTNDMTCCIPFFAMHLQVALSLPPLLPPLVVVVVAAVAVGGGRGGTLVEL